MSRAPKAKWDDEGDCLRLLAPSRHVFASNPELHEYVYDLSCWTRREARADAKKRGTDVEPCCISRCDYCVAEEAAQ